MNQFTAPIWGDEGFSAILSMKSLPEIIKIIVNDTSPPLWNIFEWLAFRIFGAEEVVIRSLTFIFFAGAIFFTYKIGAHLWNKKVGLLAATLTFLNPFFFIYAFEGRMYSILALGVTASMYFFLKRNWVGYVAATLWALYSHHFAIFAVSVQGLWFLKEFFWGKRKVAISIFKAFIAISVLYTPWLYPLYKQTQMVGRGFWLGTPGVLEFLGLIAEYLGAGIRGAPFEIFGLRLYQIAAFTTFIILIFRKWRKDMGKTSFLLAWFLGPITLTWLVSQVFQSIFFNRYLLYTIPAAMLILATNKTRLTKVLLAVLIFLFAIIDWYYFTHPTKLPFPDLASYVKETRREGDYLVNWYSNGTHHIWETKYYGFGAPIYVPDEGELPFFVGTALMEEGDIVREIPEDDIERVGVVTSGSVDEVTLRGYTEKESKTFGDLNFIWLQKSP